MVERTFINDSDSSRGLLHVPENKCLCARSTMSNLIASRWRYTFPVISARTEVRLKA